MADKKDSELIDLATKLFARIANPEAYTRKTKTPILINRSGTSSSGQIEFDPDMITLNTPSGGRASTVESGHLQDVLKHELVHQILKNVSLPEDYSKAPEFYNSLPPGNDLSEKMSNLFNMSRPTSGNQYNFQDWGRAGASYREIPAYMSIYRPEESGYAVTQATRDQYMQNLMDYLKSHMQQKAAQSIQQLMQGRQAYLGTGLFPEEGQ